MDVTGRQFPTTKWAVVVGLSGDEAQRKSALGELCLTYWEPLYTTAMRSGLGREDAQDMVQDFAVHLIEKRVWDAADPERGRMRAFLGVSLRNFISQWRRRGRAKKRGGGKVHFSIDGCGGGEWIPTERSGVGGAREEFDRRWAECLLARAERELKGRFDERGRGEDFMRLFPHKVPGSGRGKIGNLAAEMGVSEDVVRTKLTRMRSEYGEIVRELVRETLVDESLVEDELEALMSAFG